MAGKSGPAMALLVAGLIAYPAAPVRAQGTGTITADPAHSRPRPVPAEKPEQDLSRSSGAGHAVQRMLLAPGCYVLEPGQVYAASAYCLDKDLPAAAAGVPLAAVPSSMGDTVMRAGAGSLTLSEAVARHVVSVESLGRGDYFHVAIRNLSGRRLDICVRTATVIGAPSSAGPDLKPIQSDIQALLPPLKQAKLGSSAPVYGGDDTTHAMIQDKIWQKTKRLKDSAQSPPFDGEPFVPCGHAGTSASPPTGVVISTRCRE